MTIAKPGMRMEELFSPSVTLILTPDVLPRLVFKLSASVRLKAYLIGMIAENMGMKKPSDTLNTVACQSGMKLTSYSAALPLNMNLNK